MGKYDKKVSSKADTCKFGLSQTCGLPVGISYNLKNIRKNFLMISSRLNYYRIE